MSPQVMTMLSAVGLIAGILIGMPVSTVLMSIGVVIGFAALGPLGLDIMTRGVFAVMMNDTLVALPLFVFMGCMLQSSGIADRLFHNLRLALGSLRGGLGIVTILISTILAATTGIIGTAVVMMGVLALPKMLETKYSKPLAAGIVCAGGTLGILIPPSIMLILYGLSAGVSIVSLFAAAIVPGLLLAGLYMLYIAIVCYFRPELGPPCCEEERALINPATFASELVISLAPPLALILGVLGAILFGIATPTEAAGIGALSTVLLCLAMRKFSWIALRDAAKQTAQVSSTILWLMVCAQMFTSVFLGMGGGEVIKDWILAIAGGNPTVVLFIMMVSIFLLGQIVCWTGILLIVVPIFTPIAITMGWDPIWFGMLVCVNLQISFLSPPFAYAIFYLKQVAPPELQLQDLYRGVWPFIGLQALGLLLVALFPELALWLPRLLLR
ncbi:MAG: C4-dicarboxylate TRAP transporter large permease protein DctM [Firmicutes bacterium]|nr:C4-dicarboxylate TRAP transporter large permease protein DctM [Bacillota bacterium]